MATRSDHPRLHLHGFIPLDLCKELEFIHRSCSTVGYRPYVFSTTLSHLIATDCSHLILPFVPIRDRIKECVESFFGCEFELFIEFTGLVSWCKGACIGWHSDDNRPYLKQRDFAAVCYLNSHEKDFSGGIFHFEDGEPSSVAPVAGDVLMYTADSRNIHSVDEVLDGERLTLTLWFTRNEEHDEDAKLIPLLSQRFLPHENVNPSFSLPSPASDNMYWFSDSQSGFDIRYARISSLGFQIFSYVSMHDSSVDHLELLNKPLLLGRNNEVYDMEFVNGLHALQVVQLYQWKSPLYSSSGRENGSKIKLSATSLIDKMKVSKLVLPCDELTKKILGPYSLDLADKFFNLTDFELALEAWEDYSKSLHQDLLVLMPHWVSNHTICYVNPKDLLEGFD